MHIAQVVERRLNINSFCTMPNHSINKRIYNITNPIASFAIEELIKTLKF